jgi:hypothetical protein
MFVVVYQTTSCHPRAVLVFTAMRIPSLVHFNIIIVLRILLERYAAPLLSYKTSHILAVLLSGSQDIN